MATGYKWKPRKDGGAELKTDALHIIVSQRDGGGWEYAIFNTGHYKRLYQHTFPVGGDLAYHKGQCLTLAVYVLRDEQKKLEAVGD